MYNQLFDILILVFNLLQVRIFSIYKTQMKDVFEMHQRYGVCILNILHRGLKNKYLYFLNFPWLWSAYCFGV